MKFFFLFLVLLSAHSADARFTVIEKDKSLEIHHDGKLVTAFRSDHRVPYIHPLMSPSGANVTRYWPMDETHAEEERDHPHHRGLWLAHGAVNGFDFWAFQDQKDAAISVRSIKGAISDDGGSANLTADLVWSGGGSDMLREVRTFVVSKPDPLTLRIVVNSQLTALLDKVVLGDTKEGTFAIRMDRTLRVKGRHAASKLVNSNGETDANAWGKRAVWTAMVGPDELGKPCVVAIIDHAKSFRHPTHWHARDYGLLAANPFGIHDFEKKADKKLGEHVLAKDENLNLEYTVIIHHGTLESAKLPQ